MENHSTCSKDAIFGITTLTGLSDGVFRATNKMLLLISLDPEVLRIVGYIGKYGDEGTSRKCAMQAFVERAIEVRD